jgi:hypothetical protein
MDVRIGSLEATVVDSGRGTDDAQVERIARRVLALVERRLHEGERARSDRKIASPDGGDVERYG